MMIIQTIVGILLAMSAICFLLLAALDRTLGKRQQARANLDLEPASGIHATGRLLRAVWAKRKRAAARDRCRAEADKDGHTPRTNTRDLEKAA